MKTVFLLLTASAILLFQNCSNVSLEQPPFIELLSASYSAEMCLSPGRTIEAVQVANLNLVAYRQGTYSDSDADGLPDFLEEQIQFNPLKRRSHAPILDSLCFDLSGGSQCGATLPRCTTQFNKVGLNDCDIKSIGLDSLFSHPTQGLDSDKDGVPDLLEILRGTRANIADNLNDPDQDGILNQSEIAAGTNPRYHNSDIDLTYIVKYTATKKANSSCPGEFWRIQVQELPIGRTQAFVDEDAQSSQFDLSHGSNENMILTTIKTRPLPGFSGRANLLFHLSRLSDAKVHSLRTQDFIDAGEMEP